MKKISPDEIKKDLETAKKVSYTPAGAKGIDKLKLALCRGVRKTFEGVGEALANEDTAFLTAVGVGALGLGGLHYLVSGHGLPKEAVIPSAVAAVAPVIGAASAKIAKGIRNLEASLIKRIRRNDANPLLTAQMKAQHAR